MIAFAPTVARLKAAGFLSVDGLLEMVGLSDAPRADPALFVVPERSSAQPNKMSGVIDQKVSETFSVVVIVKGARRGETVSDLLKVHCDAVVDALVGWTHPEASRACEYAGERLVSMDGPQVAWAVSFNASRHIRKESQ
ncbi:phage tail terminator protein [Sphingobium aromaticiconvertens]|uniref:phage tail terminator protein n=1 Tax=Sphingobium aromaticiconvertens TaxID=365341 RepID=UPI0030174C1A